MFGIFGNKDELRATVKFLEGRVLSLRMQKADLQAELRRANRDNARLKDRINAAEQRERERMNDR